jgi:hypothetical protein
MERSLLHVMFKLKNRSRKLNQTTLALQGRANGLRDK